MNIGSIETELLIKLLNEFRSEPNDLSSLVQALRQKGYCKSLSTAYRYANRILAIRKIFMDRNAKNLSETHSNLTVTPERTRKEVEMDRQELSILSAIQNAIEDPRLSTAEKQQLCESGLQKLSVSFAKHLHEYEQKAEREGILGGSDRGRYKKLHEHGLVF